MADPAKHLTRTELDRIRGVDCPCKAKGAVTYRELSSAFASAIYQRDALAKDCQILLAQIDYLCEASGESLDREDADLVVAIRGRFQKS